MAINKKDIIGMINSYRRSRGKKALPAGANLADYDAQDKYLTDLVSKSPTEEIQIMTPEDAQQISKAINMLGSFDNIGTVEDMREKIERGTEVAKVFFQQENKVEPPIANIDQTFREQSAFGSVPEEVGYRRGIRTLGMLKKTRDDWMQKKDYVYFPLKEDKKYWEKHPDLNFERGQYIKDTANTYWMELSKELPDDTRIRVQSLLNQTQDANHLFELDKNRYTSIFSDIIAKYSDQAKGQGALADNTLINIADFTDLEKEAFQKIESFSTLPTQTEVMPKYSNAMAELQSIFQAFGYKTTAERNEEKA